MKHSYHYFASILAAFLISGSTASAQQINNKISIKDARITPTSVVNTKSIKPIKMMADKVSMPKSEKIYFYSGAMDKWALSVARYFVYGDYSQPLSWEEEIYREDVLLGITKFENTFNEEGQVLQYQTSVRDNKEDVYRNENLIKFKYDNIRKDVKISRGEYSWDKTTNDWVVKDMEAPFDCEITRNDNNDVINMKMYNNVDRDFLFNEFTYTYGGDNGATNMDLSSLNEDGIFGPLYVYSNIKWQKTDNQYIQPSNNLLYFFEKDTNNLPSEYVLSVDGGEGGEDYPIATVLIYYDEFNRPTQYNISMEGSLYLRTCEYDPEEGVSLRLTEYNWYDDDSDGEFTDSEFYGGAQIINKVNENNDIIEYTYNEFYVADGSDMSILEGEKYEYVYENGNITEKVTSKYDLDKAEYAPFSKIVRSDYEDISTAIKVVDSKPIASYINNRVFFNNAEGDSYIITDLQGNKIARGNVTKSGISVENLPSGIYMVKVMGQHGAAMKIVTK